MKQAVLFPDPDIAIPVKFDFKIIKRPVTKITGL